MWKNEYVKFIKFSGDTVNQQLTIGGDSTYTCDAQNFERKM